MISEETESENDEEPSVGGDYDALDYDGQVLLLGFGSIGYGTFPLLQRHIKFSRDLAVTILTHVDRQSQAEEAAQKYGGVKEIILQKLTPSNYESIFEHIGLSKGDLIINMSVDVSSFDVMRWCSHHGVLYIDTCIEPWAGHYANPNLTISERSNYALREGLCHLQKELPSDGPTAIVTHGANPGAVSHFVKEALLNIGAAFNAKANSETMIDMTVPPQTQQEWAQLARNLGVQTIQISERDTQRLEVHRRPTDFFNTWSVDGFLSEGCQPSELGWGTHEKDLPSDGHHHSFGCDAAIYLDRPGAGTRVRSWTPTGGAHLGFLITHNEAISLADYFTMHDTTTSASVTEGGGRALYRPTVMYAYRPCDMAVLALEELAANDWDMDFFTNKKVIVEEIVDGIDELGVLVMGVYPECSNAELSKRPFAYWYGSQLDCQTARNMIDHNSATSLQVTSAVIASAMWAIRHPNHGILEPESVPHKEILTVMRPYIEPVVGVFTDWSTVTAKRGLLFPDAQIADPTDPWQFYNFRLN